MDSVCRQATASASNSLAGAALLVASTVQNPSTSACPL